ncbi:hypothetical protein [Sagittula salina]|uniref:Uncharacterized protein n=1 Tax=Sagittula salina TaxID=2820268 RepID=A0A940S387_9RHOB|nr:hypothetical protein [Sagittula salina]MBP0484836.1 hypothetical protein [Sagittula salina]
MAPRVLSFVPALIAGVLLALPAAAQEDAADTLNIELNSLKPQNGNCRMTF